MKYQSSLENAECAICMLDYQIGEKQRKLRCNHVFHRACINIWIVQRSNQTCPLCRAPINEAELSASASYASTTDSARSESYDQPDQPTDQDHLPIYIDEARQNLLQFRRKQNIIWWISMVSFIVSAIPAATLFLIGAFTRTLIRVPMYAVVLWSILATVAAFSGVICSTGAPLCLVRHE